MFTARTKHSLCSLQGQSTVYVHCKNKGKSMFTARTKHSLCLHREKGTVYVYSGKKAQSMFTASNRTNINIVVSIQYIHNISVSIV